MSLFEFDKKFIKSPYHALIGVDEVGRGPLAGPVVSCAVRFTGRSEDRLIRELGEKIDDSKKMSPNNRRRVLERLGIDLSEVESDQKLIFGKSNSDTWSYFISEISPASIDQYNILNASLMAMHRSASGLFEKGQEKLLVDGNRLPMELPPGIEAEAIIKGDSKSFLIALASIIAKEYRDKLMQAYAQEYPGYGFEKHSGYPTRAHLEAVKRLGVTPIHRKTFKGVKEHLKRAKLGV